MRTLFHSLLGRRTRQAKSVKPAKVLPRRRPEVEALEDRALPSISLPTPGHPGPVVITGTSGPDQFVIRLQASPAAGGTTSPVNIQFSDDGGKTFQTAALADVTQVTVNGAGGTDLLTLDMGNGLIGNTATGGLPIQFTGTSGHQILDVTGSPTGAGTVTETFTLGSGGTASTLTIGNGTSSTTVSVNASTPIVDSLSATNFVFNGTPGNDLIQLQGLSKGGTSSLVISGLNAFSVPGSFDQDNSGDKGNGDDNNGNGNGDHNHDDKTGVLNFLEDQDETTSNAFAALFLSNKTDVTVNGQGGDDLFVVNLSGVPAGLKTLTIDGGTGTNVLVGRSLPTGLTTNLVNIQRQDTDNDSILIDLLFAERLGRTVDQAGLNYWLGVLNSQGRMAAIDGIEDSLEAHVNLLRNWYRHLLGRDLDPAGQQFWTSLMNQGATEEQVQAGILGSQEFMQRAQNLIGGSDSTENFIRAVYQLMLNRDTDPQGLGFWKNVLQTATPQQAALAILQSQEFRTLAIASYYETLLGRSLDPAGQNFWTSQTQDLRHIREGIEGSDEFSRRG